MQFEIVAMGNAWNVKEMALKLVLAFNGNAAEILESLPSRRDNFDEIKTALHRKYAGKHKVEIHHMELSGRMQKTGESLEDFALQIGRLVQLAYPGESHPLLE